MTSMTSMINKLAEAVDNSKGKEYLDQQDYLLKLEKELEEVQNGSPSMEYDEYKMKVKEYERLYDELQAQNI